MDENEHLRLIELKDQLDFARNEVSELKKEIKRLKELLNGDNIIENSLSSHRSTFDRLKSSYRNKKL